MHCIGKQVTHKIFGSGTVVSLDNDILCVAFSGETGQKRFSYPAVFDEHLSMEDPKEKAAIESDVAKWKQHLAKRQKELAAQRAEKQQQYLDALVQEKAEKRTAAKKTTKKSTAAAKPKRATTDKN